MAHFLNIVFNKAEIFNSMKFILSIFLSWIMPLMLYLKSHCHAQGHVSFVLYCLLGVLCFTLRSTIYFELIFVKGIRFVSMFIFFFCKWVSSCSSIICWKDYLCSIVSLSFLCQSSLDYIYVGLFLDFLFCSVDLFVYFFCQSHTLLIPIALWLSFESV